MIYKCELQVVLESALPKKDSFAAVVRSGRRDAGGPAIETALEWYPVTKFVTRRSIAERSMTESGGESAETYCSIISPQ